ncbi:hypothetical protein EMCRGX_G026788 [Ephydatia muelleri]
MALVRFICTFVSALLLITSNIFTGYIANQVFQIQSNELFFPTKREQQRFKWQPKNVSEQPPPLPPRAATIYLITSTRPHNTQKLDLTSLCQTLMHVPDLVWIVVEASTVKSKSVGKVLERCQVPSIHLNVPEHSNLIEQRNAGLNFLTTEFCNVERCHGVVCFGNEGTKYDLRLFSEIRKTEGVSVFTAAFSSGMLVEGPLCKEGTVDTWLTINSSVPRAFPVSTLGLAVHTQLLLQHPSIQYGMTHEGSWVEENLVETTFLETLGLTQDRLECRSDNKEVLVWNTASEEPVVSYERFQHSEPGILF